MTAIRPGKGGSIDAASIVGVNGLLLAGSGYGMFGQAPGNVLLAFLPVATAGFLLHDLIDRYLFSVSR